MQNQAMNLLVKAQQIMLGGGAHGFMHKVDSVPPIQVTETDKCIDHLRMVDLNKWILEVLK
jgi:hypothetical protein